LGARGSPFPAGLGLGFRLGLLGLGAIATVLRGFGAVCDLVFIRQGKPLPAMRVGVGVYARFGAPGVWKSGSQMRGLKTRTAGESHGEGWEGKTTWPLSSPPLVGRTCDPLAHSANWASTRPK